MKAIVIGGGIIGSSIAWKLASEGVKVVVLERGRLGREASWAAQGLIGPQADAEGPGPHLGLCIHGKRSFDANAERLRSESGIDFEYDHDGVLFVAFDSGERAELEQQARWQRAANLNVEELSGIDARKLAPALSSDVVFALHHPDNWRVENRKLTQAYAATALNKGALFREGAGAAELITRGGRGTGVRIDDGSIEEADVIVNAAGSWASQIRGLEADSIKVRPVRGQILCFDGRPGAIGPTLFSMHGTLVPRRDGRLLAGSVFEEAGFDKSVTLEAIAQIADSVRAMVPGLANVRFRESWAGLRPAAPDMLPVLGRSPSVANVFYAAGHYRSGILLSALTGEIVADLIMGRKPSCDLTPFSPARFAGASG